jgi:DNA-binding MarR family transcriptional regulator
MDYEALAAEMLGKMQALRKSRPQKHISDSLHGEAFVLRFIAHRDGNVLPGEIGSEMGVSSARVAVALNSLESKGLITRQMDTSDRRKILVTITPEGKTLEEKHQRIVIEATAKLLALLGEHDAVEYVRIMGRLGELSHDWEMPSL